MISKREAMEKKYPNLIQQEKARLANLLDAGINPFLLWNPEYWEKWNTWCHQNWGTSWPVIATWICNLNSPRNWLQAIL